MADSKDFDSFYHERLGERWPTLRQALLAPGRRIALPLHVKSGNASGIELEPSKLDLGEAPVAKAYASEPEAYYVMDYASLLGAHMLPVQEGMTVWDACAAPGGKSMVLLQKLGSTGKLWATDLSKTRLFKMRNMLESSYGSLPDNLNLRPADAIQWGFRHQMQYDSVLLDAPCSSERHVLADAKALNQWAPARVKTLVKRQYALLCSGMLALRCDGHLLYATCSVNPLENDDVIARYLKRKSDATSVSIHAPLGKATQYGWMVSPDTDHGWGPLYCALLRKKTNKQAPDLCQTGNLPT